MKRLQAFLGYFLAALAPLILLVTLFGMNEFAKMFASFTQLQISPWQTGGAVVQVLERPGYTIKVYETVFDALIGESPEGFVQLEWTPTAKIASPLKDLIDYNGDQQPDFDIDWDWKAQTPPQVKPLTPAVLGTQEYFYLKESLVLRVRLKNLP